MDKNPPAQIAPTRGLYLGLIITLLAVLAYAAYITMQFSGIRKLQSEMVDRNRKDSLQLLRIQNDLNSLGLAMRDMLDPSAPYPLAAWSAQFDRIRNDLQVAMQQEESLAEAARTSDQRHYLSQSLSQFWDASDRMFTLAGNGSEGHCTGPNSRYLTTPPGRIEFRCVPTAGAKQRRRSNKPNPRSPISMTASSASSISFWEESCSQSSRRAFT